MFYCFGKPVLKSCKVVASSASRCGEFSLLVDGFFLLELRNSSAVPAYKNVKAFLKRKLGLDAICIIFNGLHTKGSVLAPFTRNKSKWGLKIPAAAAQQSHSSKAKLTAKELWQILPRQALH